jgi:UDP-N-acetylmuramoyl-tripeptide--D-alanyl-D-alanine ligase
MKKLFKQIVQFYLKLLTKFVLWRHKPFVIAVAGTTNKTTVKEYILKFLREKYPPHRRAGGDSEVRGNPRSYNTEIGLPLAILYLDSGESSPIKWIRILLQGTVKAILGSKFPSKLVLELGVSEKGDMEYLLEMVRPSVAIVTNIEGSYTYTDSSLDVIFEEMKLLVGKIPQKGKVILNSDDERVKNLARAAKAEVITYGLSEEAQARAKNLASDAEGQNFEFIFKDREESVKIKKYGRHNVYAWMIAKIVKSIL